MLKIPSNPKRIDPLKKTIISNHVKSSVKHASGKICIEMKEAREKDIAESLDNEIHPKGQDLTMARRVWRSKC